MARDSEQEIEEFEYKVCYIHFHWENWVFLASVGTTLEERQLGI